MNAIEAVAIGMMVELERRDGIKQKFPEGRPPQALIDLARAALTALRDNGVTGQMWDAWASTEGPDAEFRAMLDAALKGE